MDQSGAFAHPFYFLRHGETHWNRSGTTQGQIDSKLNETGIAQAEPAAEALAGEPIERIVASPRQPRPRHGHRPSRRGTGWPSRPTPS